MLALVIAGSSLCPQDAEGLRGAAAYAGWLQSAGGG